MITKSGKVIFNDNSKKWNKMVAEVTEFSFDGNSKDIYLEIGDWLLDNFKESFKDMGLELTKIIP